MAQTPTDERMLEVLAAIDGALSQQHATTAELLIAARQMTVSALAQIREDNPKADIIRVAGDYCWELQKAILRRFCQTEPTQMGEA